MTELAENDWQSRQKSKPTESEIEEANKKCIQQSVKSLGNLCMIGLATWFLCG
jgi:hypothetical protein